MKAKILSALSILLIALLATSAIAFPIDLQKVEIDGQNVRDNDEVRLDVQRGQDVEIELTMIPEDDIEDLEIRAFISGYEYEDIADSIGPIDMDKGVKYRKTLTLTLPEDAEEDDYKVRLMFVDRNGHDVIIQNYQIKVDLPRHKIALKDVIFHPGKNIEAGTALLAQIRLENMGEKDETDVVVKLMIPELGTSATDYIDEIESGEQEETEELYLRIPAEAEAGLYSAQIYVGYNNNHDKTLATTQISIEAAEVQETTVVVDVPVEPVEETSVSLKSTIKTVLEVVLLVLVALLVVIGLIIGFTRLGRD